MSFWKKIIVVITCIIFVMLSIFIVTLISDTNEVLDIYTSNHNTDTGHSKEMFYQQFLILVSNNKNKNKNEESDDSVVGGSGNKPSPIPAPNYDSLPTLSKSIASHFKDADGKYYYSQTGNNWDGDITTTYNGRTVTVKKTVMSHNDCSCFVALMLYAMGVQEPYRHMTSDTFMSWGVPTGAKTFADVEVGDIFAKVGHVAICVKKDDKYVYMADCGNTNRITMVAKEGVCSDQKFKLTDNVATWRKKGKITVRRAKSE